MAAVLALSHLFRNFRFRSGKQNTSPGHSIRCKPKETPRNTQVFEITFIQHSTEPPMTAAVTQAEATEKSRQGALLGNQNAARHGLRGSGLPKGCGHIRRAINIFRRTCEAAVFEDRGEISLTDAAHINTAFRWERHAQLAQRWLLLESETMNAADRLSYSQASAKASSERDKSIARLNLPKATDADPWAVVDAQAPEKPQEAARKETP